MELNKLFWKSEPFFNTKQNVNNYYQVVHLNDIIGLIKVTLIVWSFAMFLNVIEIVFEILMRKYYVNKLSRSFIFKKNVKVKQFY